MSEHSQFRLLGSKRFLPFFLSQLLGAFNDNLFKQALILAILFKLSFNADRDLLINLSALLFILPFFLFSALGGQFGEKFDKDMLIRRIKLGEVGIMLLGALGLWLGSLPLLLVVLFAMGTQSALFGPVKYSILPQALAEDELVGGGGDFDRVARLARLRRDGLRRGRDERVGEHIGGAELLEPRVHGADGRHG